MGCCVSSDGAQEDAREWMLRRRRYRVLRQVYVGRAGMAVYILSHASRDRAAVFMVAVVHSRVRCFKRLLPEVLAGCAGPLCLYFPLPPLQGDLCTRILPAVHLVRVLACLSYRSCSSRAPARDACGAVLQRFSRLPVFWLGLE